PRSTVTARDVPLRGIPLLTVPLGGTCLRHVCLRHAFLRGVLLRAATLRLARGKRWCVRLPCTRTLSRRPRRRLRCRLALRALVRPLATLRMLRRFWACAHATELTLRRSRRRRSAPLGEPWLTVPTTVP